MSLPSRAIQSPDSLQPFINSLRTVIAREDAFGQALIRLNHRKSRVTARGLFHHVRAVQAAVLALGGAVGDARAWTGQALRWQRDGRAVDSRFAPYEVNPVSMNAMNALLRLLGTLPTDLIPPPPVTASPFGRPFPASPPSGNQQSSSSPFGRPPTAPQGAAPSTTPRPFTPRSPFAPDPVPPYLAAIFDALATLPDAVTPSLDLFARMAQRQTDDAETTDETSEMHFTYPEALEGLYTLYNAASNDVERAAILHQIGLRNDPRAIDYFYSLFKGTDHEPRLLNIFAHIGGDVGIAGLFTLLPIPADRRVEWLEAVSGVLLEASERAHPLNPRLIDALWDVARAETAPTVAFCASAFELLANLRTPEAAEILFARARKADRDDLRGLLFALLTFDPGERLNELLALYATYQSTPQPLFGSRADPERVGIPFEALAAVVESSKSKFSQPALHLIGFVQDPRVNPFLITQLQRRAPALRETALRHLQRLKAREAVDAIAALMDKDAALSRFCAEILCDWDDPRCVPVLIDVARKDERAELDKVVKRLGRFRHPAFDAWLLEDLDTLTEAEIIETEDALIAAIDALAEVKSESLPLLLERLESIGSVNMRVAVVRALHTLESDWARQSIRRFALTDKAPLVAYTAAQQSKDSALGEDLMRQRSEIRRVLGVRVLWNAKQANSLVTALSDESAAVRDLAIFALGALHDRNAVPALEAIIDQEDRIDVWSMNPAALAWRALVRMGAASLKPESLSATR